MGGRGHRPDRPQFLAGRVAADPAQSAPTPGAQLTFTDVDGHRITAFLTGTPPGVIPCQIAAFRYRVLPVAAQLTRSARRTWLRVDRTWRWAAQIADGFRRLRAAGPGPAAMPAGTPRPQEHHADEPSRCKGFQRRSSRP